jgi:hypothetical protein
MAFVIRDWIINVVLVLLLGMEVFALIDCAIRRADAFPAAGKLTKPGWLLILVLSIVVTYLFRPMTAFLGLAGVVASIVYLVDVRPAVKQISGGGPGPHGRW